MNRWIAYMGAGAVALTLGACTKKNAIYPDKAAVPYTVLSTLPDGSEVRNGGMGSAMTAHPSNSDEFYLLTDRGPNAKFTGPAGKGKKFPVPFYTPRIGHYKVVEGNIKLKREILLRDPHGKVISGLPNPEGMGATGEVPYNADGQTIGTDPYGVDSEGIVALRDGGFWISDEYGPHIIRYNAKGIEQERINPFGSGKGGRKLPTVFKRRRANRGMEGLAITPDEKVLVGIMQSTMYNPTKKDITNKTLTRIVTFDITTSQTKQYLYRQEADNLSNSEIVAITNDTFLVIERDGKFQGSPEKPAEYKRIYKIDLRGATDVSGTDVTAPNGMLLEGKTLEQTSWANLAKAGIEPVRKELVADLLVDIPGGYPHEKLEGIWLINDQKIAVANDDDFALSASNSGTLIQKVLPATGKPDSNMIYWLDLKKPLK